MVDNPPRIPASADSIAAKLAAEHRTALIGVIDVAIAALSRADAVLTAIDALDLGVGGQHYDTLCALRDIGAREVSSAIAELRAVPVSGEPVA